jgi:hypothetical protein
LDIDSKFDLMYLFVVTGNAATAQFTQTCTANALRDRQNPAGQSEVKLRCNLENTHVARAIVFAKVGAEHGSAAGGPDIVRNRQSREITKDRVSGLS